MTDETASGTSPTTDKFKSIFSDIASKLLAKFNNPANPNSITVIQTFLSDVSKNESTSAQQRADYLDSIIDYSVCMIFSIFEATELLGEPNNSPCSGMLGELSILLDKLFRSKVLGPEISVNNLCKVLLLASERCSTLHKITEDFSYPVFSFLLNGQLDRTNLLVALLRTLMPKTSLRAWLTTDQIGTFELSGEDYNKRQFDRELNSSGTCEGNAIHSIFADLIRKFDFEMYIDGVKYLKFYGKCEKNPFVTCPELRLDELMKEIDLVIWRVNKSGDKDLIKNVDRLLELLIDYSLDRDQTIFDHLSLVPEGKNSPLARYLQSMIDAKLNPPPVTEDANTNEKSSEPKEKETNEDGPSLKKAKPNDAAADDDDDQDLAVLKQIMNMQQTLLSSQQQLLAKLIPFVGDSNAKVTSE